MTPEEFARGFYNERKYLLDLYFDSDKTSDVSKIISSLNLDSKESERLRSLLGSVLRDAFYTVLLGLEGEASIGGKQEMYKVTDEIGNELTGGDIETFAWEYFHNNKFEIDSNKFDFVATVRYLTTEKGGRKTPAMSGYRPQVKFDFSEMQTSGQQIFLERNLVFPGDEVDVGIEILSVDHFANKLKEGMRFDFLEGSRLIGSGRIKRILNDRLKA